MIDEKGAATTMWQDNHSGLRGHQLMTEKLADAIPALGANSNVADCDDILAPAKLFSPYSNWTWYITEMDPETGQCFGLVEGFERELGYFDLSELAETTVFGGVPAVERDLYWEPKTLGEIKNGSHKDSPAQRRNPDIGETMTDESGTEIHPLGRGERRGVPLRPCRRMIRPADVGGELPAEGVRGGRWRRRFDVGRRARHCRQRVRTANEEAGHCRRRRSCDARSGRARRNHRRS